MIRLRPELDGAHPRSSSKFPVSRLTWLASLAPTGCVAYPYGLDRKQALFAALDGHGEMGEMVSGFAMHEIQARLENHPDFIPDVEKAFKEVFVEVDEALKEQKGIDAMYSGTTVVAVLMRGKQVRLLLGCRGAK